MSNPGQPALADLLPEDAQRFGFAATDWREAITEAGRLLVSAGCATSDYTRQMIDVVDRFGPYIVIAPGFALAHAQASESVFRTGMSWVQLSDPVSFGHPNDPVTLVVGLASRSHDDHVAALQELGSLLSDDTTRAAALTASNTLDIEHLFANPKGRQS